MSLNYSNLITPEKSYSCNNRLMAVDLDDSLYNPLIEVIDKLNFIGNYIQNNENIWSSNSEGQSEVGDTLQFPLDAINTLGSTSGNKILYYNNSNTWTYKDYKELQYPLSELYNLPADQSLDLSETKYVLVYDQETLNDRGWKFLPYNTGTGSGLTLGKVAYSLNIVDNPSNDVKQILVWDSDGNNNWGWRIENYSPTSPTTGLTWDDLINVGSNKINKSHLPALTWWGNGIPTDSNNSIEGNLQGNIEWIKFETGSGTNYKSVYLGIDSNGNLRVSKSENGNDGATGANFYATGGVSALGNSSSGGGGGGDVTPGETSLKALLNNVNDLGTNYANPSTGYTIVYDNGSWIDRKLDLSELGNVSINSVSNNDVLTYNGTNWVNSPAQSVVSSLEQLSDVEDDVSNIKVQNVIEPSGSVQSYSYPLTLLVGSTSDTSSNIYNSEVTWKQYVFQLETDSTAAHQISGGSLTSNMGIVTRLNFGQAGSPMNNYRFPTYITGVRQQSSDMTRYHITGAKHIKGKTINNNSQTWNLDYDETFCSDKVYIINGELYSNANKVLTTNSTLSSSNLNNNSVTFNGASASLGSSGTITPELVIDGNTIKSKVGNQTSTGITVPFATTAGTADKAKSVVDNYGIGLTKYAWGQKYLNNGEFLEPTDSITVTIPNSRSQDDGNNHNGIIIKRGSQSTNFYFDAVSTTNSVIRMVGDNIIDYVKGVSNSGLIIGYGSRPTISTTLSGKDVSLQVYDPDPASITEQNPNPGKDVIKLTTGFQTYLPQATQASSGLRIGDAILYWDNSNNNNSLALVKSDGTPCNFYATGGVSALGFSNGTSSMDAMTFGNLTVNSHLTLGTYATVNKLVMDGNISMHENKLMFETSNETESSITTYYEGGLDGIIINSDHDIVLNADNNYYIMDGSDVYRFNIGAAQTAGILTQM